MRTRGRASWTRVRPLSPSDLTGPPSGSSLRCSASTRQSPAKTSRVTPHTHPHPHPCLRPHPHPQPHPHTHRHPHPRLPPGAPPGGWMPQQCVSRYQALRGYTRDAAFAAFQERFPTLTSLPFTLHPDLFSSPLPGALARPDRRRLSLRLRRARPRHPRRGEHARGRAVAHGHPRHLVTLILNLTLPPPLTHTLTLTLTLTLTVGRAATPPGSIRATGAPPSNRCPRRLGTDATPRAASPTRASPRFESASRRSEREHRRSSRRSSGYSASAPRMATDAPSDALVGGE